jgi:phosphoadenosine phosphosulfate reductase
MGRMMVRNWTEQELAGVAQSLEGGAPDEALRWAYAHFPPNDIALACSFGAEDVALVDMVAKLQPGAHLFYLDTDLLFPQTYSLIAQVQDRYDVQVDRITPMLTLTEQAEAHGDSLWASQPDRCCAIRKVEPLTRKLSGLKAWITGIRREQGPTRANAKPVEWDSRFGLVKINPLVAWSERDVWNYISANQVPYNPLHDQGYPSIGCTHCTRTVAPGEDPRAGRWSGFTKTECGLHQ